MSASDLTPELAKEILAAAASRGLTVEEFLESVASNQQSDSSSSPQSATDDEHFQLTATPEEWSRALREWIGGFPSDAPPLSDYAVSRESIYTREDEML
ncbi:MAG TPA: hypothetical protein VJ464_20185 [Blastocatellia bacterium]|nr:hypothetical protein [Blastocatellia bacterium]